MNGRTQGYRANNTFHLKSLIGCAVVSSLCACASIDSIPLNADGTAASGVHGVRYYLPKPYLLVTELPSAPNPISKTANPGNPAPLAAGGGGHGGGGGGGDGGGGNGGGQQGGNSQGTQPQTAAPSSSPADTSFSATMAQYAVKIVYLPDFSHPYALQMSAGLFGTASFAPSLTDGWMLTSLNGSSDNSSMLSAIASMVGGGGSSGGGGGGGKTAAGAAAAGAAALAAVPPAAAADTEWQRFGQNVVSGAAQPAPLDTLNSLDATKLSAYISGVANATGATIDPNVLRGLTKANLVALASAMGKAGQAVANAASTAQRPLPWGNNVLPAGLYEFVYSNHKDDTTSKINGTLTGLMPVTFFCKGYVELPTDSERNTFRDLTTAGAPRPRLTTPCNHDAN